MREMQAIALVTRHSENKFVQELITFLIDKGFLSEKQMSIVMQEARLIETNLTHPKTKRFKKIYRYADIKPILDELGCDIIRHPESGYVLTDGNGMMSGVVFKTYRELVVWACSGNPNHPLSGSIAE